VLPHSFILLPASRLTIPISKPIRETLLSLIDESDALPIVAAIPTISRSLNSGEEPSLSGHSGSCAQAGQTTCSESPATLLVFLRGLTQVKLIHFKASMDYLLCMPIPPSEQIPSPEAVEKFEQSALRLLDRLANDSVWNSREEKDIIRLRICWTT
jgi:ATP-dependent Lon protease